MLGQNPRHVSDRIHVDVELTTPGGSQSFPSWHVDLSCCGRSRSTRNPPQGLDRRRTRPGLGRAEEFGSILYFLVPGDAAGKFAEPGTQGKLWSLSVKESPESIHAAPSLGAPANGARDHG